MQLNLVYAQFDIICLVIMIMITLKTMTLTRSLMLQRTYLLMMAFATCLVGSDLIYELVDYGLFSMSEPWIYFFNILYFVSSLSISYTWYVYTLRLIGSKLAYNVIFRGLSGVPLFIMIFMCLSTYRTHWIFYFDSEGYHRGSLNTLIMLVPLMYFITATVIGIFYHAKTRTAESVDHLKTILSFVVFPLAAVAIQAAFIGFPAVCIGASLGMLQVFLNNIAKDRENLIIHESIVKSKNDFFAGMSHEIRTPINAIIGMDTMILREAEDESIRDYAKSIDNSSKILLTLVNDILDISKIEAGKMKLIPVDYDLKDVIRDLVTMFESRAGEKGLEFIAEIDESLPSVVNGDEVRLKQVIINMLTNAVKYTSSGSIRLIIRSIEASGLNDKVRLHVSVVDTGCGMKKDQIEKIFSPYERFEEQLNRKTEGTGLGMTISKQLLNMMDSTMEVESKFGVGSTFSFSVNLPIVDKTPIGKWQEKDNTEPAEEKRHGYVPAFKAPGLKILYVDDTIVNLKVFKALLKGTKIEVDTASSGKEALGMVVKKAYDMIFVDIMMPEMDGVETFNFMKKTSNFVTEETPIIACTANALLGAKEKYMSEGFVNYISKPIEAKKLEEMIIKYIKE